jgi:hypothetical protein
VAYAAGATDLFHPDCRDFICRNSSISFLVPEAITELDLVIDGTGADDPDYRGIREKLVTEVLETAIRAENAALPYSPNSVQTLIPPMTGQHAIRAIKAAASLCKDWPALSDHLRAAASDFESGMASRKHRLLAGVNTILLTAAEQAHSDRTTARLKSLLPSGGRSWSRDCRVAAETDAVAQRNPAEPPSLVTVETRGHFHTRKAGILRLTRILEIRRCGDG